MIKNKCEYCESMVTEFDNQLGFVCEYHMQDSWRWDSEKEIFWNQDARLEPEEMADFYNRALSKNSYRHIKIGKVRRLLYRLLSIELEYDREYYDIADTTAKQFEKEIKSFMKENINQEKK